ncbi:hypothetical protein [Erythrobacter ani]|uniref:DUF2946 domain-containing protein n=1 Tax=Erythrobacter ani TaxID=2827235 RepID=A0ABS6SIW9_9SPHN|nr:hypothetical protein [Erythrobacter ani]MBV7264624.1 hypothetical protein [Erythrobacter ani]
MYLASRPFLLAMMLLAIGLRSVFGAPCCMDGALAANAPTVSASAHHSVLSSDSDEHDGEHHSEHGESPSANPCCSACGPTLPPDAATASAPSQDRDFAEPAPVRALKTRPPFPAYDATGPPLLT